MEVKEIFQKIRQREPKREEYFLALLLEEGSIKSAVWQIAGGVVKVVTLGESRIWEKEEEIIEAVDVSLSTAIEKLVLSQDSPQPSKIIFGLPPDWIKDNQIITEKLEILKKISYQMELAPIGFVAATEAIIYHLRLVEGVPPTVILAGLVGQKLRVTLVKLGRIIGHQKVDRSDHLGADLAEGLSRFGSQEVFPARVLLYSAGGKLALTGQELMDYPWGKQGINFLHLPRVEVLPDDGDIRAIALAGGREVAQIGETKIALQAELVSPEVDEVVTEEEMTGFLKGGDVAKEALVIPPEKPSLPRLSIRLPSLPLFGRPHFLGGAALAGLIILGSILVAAWWYLPSAEIILAVKSQPLEKSLVVNVDPFLAVADSRSQTLPGRPLKKIMAGHKTTTVTGTKIVGERASGKVIVYNRTSKPKTFSRETQILGPGVLKFVFGGEVTVASESAGPDYTRLPGKAEARIEATDIGAEANLASGTEFTFAGLSRSDFVARNGEALSGGTSREIMVVAKKDQDDLLSGLSEELKNKAAEELSGLAPTGQKIIPESLTATALEKKFDRDVNQEATELGLDLKSEFAALTYNPQELKSLIKDKIGESLPSGFEYYDQGEEINFNLKSLTKEGVGVFNFNIKTRLIPQLDLATIKNNLLGRRPDTAQQYFTNRVGIVGAQIKIRPSWLGPLATLPHVAKNIKIEVRAE